MKVEKLFLKYEICGIMNKIMLNGRHLCMSKWASQLKDHMWYKSKLMTRTYMINHLNGCIKGPPIRGQCPNSENWYSECSEWCKIWILCYSLFLQPPKQKKRYPKTWKDERHTTTDKIRRAKNFSVSIGSCHKARNITFR